MSTETAALVVKDLVYSYTGRGTSIEHGAAPFELRVPSLVLNTGEQIALTAGSGRGKSTLLSLLCGLLEPISGSVLIHGQNVHALHGARRDAFRGRHIGMVFQTFNLLHGFTAIENVMAALTLSGSELKGTAAETRAKKVLNDLGIERIHSPVDHLSIGQQQRVAVARAVVCGPRIILADEPTASLDPENATIALELIRRMARESGAALLCVSHDPSVINTFERRETLHAMASA